MKRQPWMHLAAHLGVLAVWELACRTIISPMFFPPPSQILWAFFATTRTGELPRQLLETLAVLTLGFAAAVVSGLAIGILMGLFKPLARVLDPYINALYAMPTVALVPLTIIWLGLGFGAKVFLTWLVSVFPVIISAHAGVTHIPPAYIETAYAFGCNRRQLFRKVIFFAAIPFFVAGLRLGLGRALVGVVVAEMFTALSGLGYMVTFYGNTFKTAYVFVPIITLATLSIVVTELIRYAERKIAPWKQTDQ